VEGNKKLLLWIYKMRKELFWDMEAGNVSSDTEIERAINFGGFAYIKEVQKKYGIKKFKHVLKNNRNLSKKAVNYWCLQFNINRNKTNTYKFKKIWTPFR
jgi:hypothetical protein